MITTFYPPFSFGGDARFVQALSYRLAERGHEVDVIHCTDSYRLLGGNASASVAPEPAGVTVHPLRSPFGFLSPLATQQTGLPLFKTDVIERIFASRAFDVIHFHNVSLAGGPGVLALGSGLKLYTIHEHWLLCPMHSLFRDNREPCLEKSCIRCALHYHRPPQFWRYTNMMKTAVRHVDSFIAPTEFTRSLHLESGLPMRIEVIPNFHDAPRPSESPTGEISLPHRPFFLYAGRLERLKGVDTLIRVFERYHAADLVIAGDGSQSAALREQARAFPHIHFLGHVPRAVLLQLYPLAIALLVPSLGIEVFPLVILEALAGRTPVIVRGSGPLPEIAAASGGGLVFQHDSELPELLHRLQSDTAARDRLGNSGYNAWRAQWTSEAHLDRYLALIERRRSLAAAAR